MIWLALALSMVSVVLLTWQVQLWLGPALSRYREIYTEDARTKLSEIFLFIDPVQLWTWAVMLSIVIAGLTYALTKSAVLTTLGVLFAVRIPPYAIAALRRRRLARFELQLPTALLTLASAIRAGIGLSTALRHVTDHSDAPLVQEFGLVLREQRLGIPFDTALEHLRNRVPSEACTLMVSALRVASHTGGNLAETLERISHTLRERLHLHGKVRALTAQGRMQAWIAGALPLLLLVVLSYIDPDSMAMLWTTPLGWCTLAVLCGLELAGMLLIRRIVAVDI